MAKTINDEFMQQVATEQAWQKLAEEYAWTEDLLEKYADKLDWKLISTNRVIRWTIPMLMKFSRKLNWEEVSERIDNDWFTEAHIEALKDKWDWSVLVRNYQLSEKLIDKYIDYIDWPSLIGAEGYYCGSHGMTVLTQCLSMRNTRSTSRCPHFRSLTCGTKSLNNAAKN